MEQMRERLNNMNNQIPSQDPLSAVSDSDEDPASSDDGDFLRDLILDTSRCESGVATTCDGRIKAVALVDCVSEFQVLTNFHGCSDFNFCFKFSVVYSTRGVVHKKAPIRSNAAVRRTPQHTP